MKSFKKTLLICMLCLASVLVFTGCSDKTKSRAEKLAGRFFTPSSLSNIDDLNLDTDDGTNYTFTYADEEYKAEFLTDTWKIYNSCRIKNSKDILMICKALSAEHPVPGRDRESYRTPEDMAFEWEQHNIAYDELPEDNYWKESSRNVDLDPDDQGKTFKEIYEDRTGKKLDLDTVIEHKGKITEKVKEKLHEENIDSDDLNPDKIKEKVKEKLREENIDSDDLSLEKIKEKLKEILKDK